jgi:hypothetical protein
MFMIIMNPTLNKINSFNIHENNNDVTVNYDSNEDSNDDANDNANGDDNDDEDEDYESKDNVDNDNESIGSN